MLRALKQQYNILNKNLNFCPTPARYKELYEKRDIKNFSRKMKLRGHFCCNKENQQADHIVSEPIIKCKSNWEPKENHYTGETFVEVVENNVKNILQVKKELPRNNVCNIDRAAIDHCLK